MVAFGTEDAKTLMLRPGSKLRTITFGGASYSVTTLFCQLFVVSYHFILQGKWVRATTTGRDPGQIEDDLIFEVVKDNQYLRALV